MLVQVLALLTMEKPVTLNPDDIRDEKLRVLRYISPLTTDDCVLGQYTSDGTRPGYLDDETVPAGSKCPTFASCVLRIHNDRWEGVPFILKAGKAVNEKKVEVSVCLCEPPRRGRPLLSGAPVPGCVCAPAISTRSPLQALAA